MIIARKDRRSTNGFTMIELLAVLGIIAILAGITFGLVSGVSERGRTARAQTELRLIAQALEQYRSHYGDYPWVNVPQYGQNDTPELLFNALAGVLGPQGHNIVQQENRYGRVFVDFSRLTLLHSEESADHFPNNQNPNSRLENQFIDPWGNPYRYFYKDENNPDNWRQSGFLLYSMGPSESHDPPNNEGTMSDSAANADNIHHEN